MSETCSYSTVLTGVVHKIWYPRWTPYTFACNTFRKELRAKLIKLNFELHKLLALYYKFLALYYKCLALYYKYISKTVVVLFNFF